MGISLYGATGNSPYFSGDKYVMLMELATVSASGSTTSTATAYANRTHFSLDLGDPKWSPTNAIVSSIKFRVIGRQQSAGNTASFILRNITDGVDIAGSELTTDLTTTYQVLESGSLNVAEFPAARKVYAVRTKTNVAGTVELYSAALEIEYTVK